MVWAITVGAGSQLGGSIPARAKTSHKTSTLIGMIHPRRLSGITRLRGLLVFLGLEKALPGFAADCWATFFQVSLWFCSAMLIFAPGSYQPRCARIGDR